MGVLPREGVLFLLGIFVFFVIFAPFKQAVLFTVFSIPLFTALPITDSFDSMAAWRIIIAILFLRVLTRGGWGFVSWRVWRLLWHGLRRRRSKAAGASEATAGWLRMSQAIIPRPPLMRLGVLVGLFLALGTLSLLVAQEPIFGIKKLLYLANIFALFFVIQEVVKSKQDFVDVLKYVFAGSVLTLVVAYAQFVTILFVPLYAFWQWWASHVIPVFYGANLGNLLSYSNTWFSYYEEAEATLRTFSIFPDSHSFALSMVLALPLALTLFLIHKGKGWRFFFGAFIVLALLAIIFSGTRGVWVGAAPVFLVLVFFYALRQWPGVKVLVKSPPSIEAPTASPNITKILTPGHLMRVCIIVFVTFVLLFPVSSQLLKFSQMRQGGIVSETSFERVSTSFSMRELSNLGRIQIWKSTIASIAARPFLGVGMGNYPVVLNENVSATKEGASAHSLYLDVASEMGLLGGILLLFIFLEIFWHAVGVFRRSGDFVFSSFAGFFAIYFLWVMAYSAVDIVLLNDKVLLLFVTLVALLYSVPRHDRIH